MKIKLVVITLLLIPILLIGGAWWGQRAAAQGDDPASSPGWLSFDGASGSGKPVMTLLAADANQIDLQASLPGANIQTITAEEQTFTRLSGEGFGYSTQVGLPELPVLRQKVEIPFGAQVSLELVQERSRTASLNELGLDPIYPLQPPVVKLEEGNGVSPFIMDREFYTQGSLYPAQPLALGETYIVRGHRILVVEAWPVAYDPSAGTLRLYSQLTIRLHLTGSDMVSTQAQAVRYNSPGFNVRLSQTVLNYNQGLPVQPASAVGYLIITADAYYDAMLPFVQLKESRGFNVTMTKTSEIPGGVSTATIKAYIQTAYDTWPLAPSYVLLVGDTNTVPTWSGPIIGTSTDLYYGTMDGSGDWHPDIGRGRFPVRSPEQTTIMVNKYLAYATLTGQEPWLKTASFPATCDNYTVAEGTHNYVIDTHTGPGGFTGTFPNDPQYGGDKLYCVTYGATHQDLINAFNQGRWAIIYSGHGGYDGWEMSFTPNDVRNLTSYGMYPFVASHACLSGDFGQVEVFGETWVLQENKGALVYWGSSTYSYWDEDDVLERVMFDSLFAETLGHADVATMTDAGLDAVEAAYPDSARYYRETYNVLGDPAVKLFMEPDQPTFTLNVEPSSHEVCSTGSLTSSVEIGSVLGYSDTVYLETGALPISITASFDPSQAPAPYTSTLTLDVAPGAPAGDHTIAITATDQISWTQSTWLDLRVADSAPAVPELFTPADGSVDQPFQPDFTWESLMLVDSYEFQLGTSPLFEAPLFDVSNLPQSIYTLPTPLDGNRCYWWRAKAENVCGEGAWAEPFHFTTAALQLAFSDDMEDGGGLWSHAATPGVDHWAISSAQSHSPTHAWFVPDDDVVTDSRLWITQPVEVGTGSSLTFWHKYSFEGTDYDGAVLEVSANGSPWADLGAYIISNGYNGTIATGWGNPLAGREGWTGDLTEWTKVEVDLSAFAGQSIQFRWRIGCDSSVSDTGWYIDDVQITGPMPPTPAPIVTEVVPNNGSPFEPTPVQILGSNFIETPNARLDDTWLLSVTLVSSTTLEAVVPAGLVSGTYTLTLYNGDCQTAVLPEAFTITSDAAPVAVDDSAVTDEETPVLIDVLANDYDPEGSPLSITAVGAPLHGSAVISGTQVLYTPLADYYGPDTFTYTASDGYLEDTASVSLTVNPVNDTPVVIDDEAVTDEDQPVLIAVLANDYDPEGIQLSITAVGAPLHGSAVISGTQVLYTPFADYYGPDTFTYNASDGYLEETASVSLTVNPVNDTPVLNPGDLSFMQESVYEGLVITLTGVFIDVDGEDTHSILVVWGDGLSETLDLPAGVYNLELGHIYADNPPGGDFYTATVTISDGQAEASQDVTALVLNAAPTLGNLPDFTIKSGSTIDVGTTFTDPGLLDAHTVVITWAEGVSQTLELAPGETSFSTQHTFSMPGIYTVTVLLRDEDGGETSATFTVTVEAYLTHLPILVRH